MAITSDPIVWILRVGPDNHAHGDSWEFSCVCTFAGECAYISAGQGRMTPSIMREIAALLKSMGFSRAAWKRFKGGGGRVIEWELR